MNLENLKTERLILIPVTLNITRSLIAGGSSEIKRLGIKSNEKWPTTDLMDILPTINGTLEKDKFPSGFEFWMIIKKEDMQVIGDIGFHGKPDEKGEVEIGYGLVENERGKGYGFEALKAIMNWLDTKDNVKATKAECLIDNGPSIRILEKAGMKEVRRTGEFVYLELKKQR